MAARTLTVTQAGRDNGTVRIQFDNGSGLELASMEHARAYIAPLAQNIDDIAMMFAVARLIHVAPNLDDFSSLVGKSITVTNEQNIMVRVQ